MAMLRHYRADGEERAEHCALWEGAHGDDLLAMIYEGVVRTPMLIESQEPQARELVKREIVNASEEYRKEDRLQLRFPYLVVWACKS